MLTTRLEKECNRWTPPNPSLNMTPKQNASIFKLCDNEIVEELHKVRVVAIGPYRRHQGNQNLLFSEAEKRIIVMLAAKVFHLNFRRFFSEISPKINDIQACYAEGSFDLDDEALSEMMLFDSCFIICAIIALTPGPLFGSTQMQKLDREEG